jgi:hypothetical protein
MISSSLPFQLFDCLDESACYCRTALEIISVTYLYCMSLILEAKML